MKRRIVSAFFGFVFAVASVLLSVVSYAAASNGIDVSASRLSPGDAFFITLSVPPAANADTVSVRVDFDASAFEVKSWAPTLANSVYNSGDGFFIVTSANAERAVDLSGGLVLRADMAVKPGAADGYYTFRLTENSFSYVASNGYEFIELWKPATTQVTVQVASGNSGSGSQSGGQTAPTDQGNTASGGNTGNTTNPTDNGGTQPPANNGTQTQNPANNDTQTQNPANSGTQTQEPSDTTTIDDNNAGSGGQSAGNNSEEPINDPDDGDDDSDTIPDGGAAKAEVSLSASLSGMSKGKVRIYTLSTYFDTDTEIRLSNTAEADQNAARALENLGLKGHNSYAFDISLYKSGTTTPIHSMSKGYIDFTIPVPEKLSKAAKSLALYHIESGYPVLVDSSVTTDNGNNFITFRSSTFSPFMIVDLSVDPTTSSQQTSQTSQPSDTGSTPKPEDSPKPDSAAPENTSAPQSDKTEAPAGISNPHTGVTAAVLVPSALVGCLVLSRKTAKKRKRSKKYLEE